MAVWVLPTSRLGHTLPLSGVIISYRLKVTGNEVQVNKFTLNWIKQLWDEQVKRDWYNQKRDVQNKEPHRFEV